MTNPSPVPECLFLDVGQGSANVVLLPDKRALLIDVGPRRAWPLLHQLLVENAVESIDCVVLSHNDRDHVGCWDSLATQFNKRTKKWYLLQDRRMEEGRAVDIALRLAEKGVIPEPLRAEVADLAEPFPIWSDSVLGLELQLLYPTMLIAMRNMERGRKNDCSAVALLKCPKDSTILFTGDVSYRSLHALAKKLGDQPVKVTIMTVPHHGSDAKRNVAELLPKVVCAEWAMISVGKNQWSHPHRATVSACCNQNSRVICTQITDQCHDLTKLSGANVMDVDVHSLSHPSMKQTAKGAGPLGTGCAGTISAALRPTGIAVLQADAHARAVSHFPSRMCKT